MLATLNTIVTGIQPHPLVSDPIPHPSSFTDQQAYRLYLQFRNTLRHLGTINADLRRASFSFCLAHQDRQAIIEWTHQLYTFPPSARVLTMFKLMREPLSGTFQQYGLATSL